MDKDLAVMTGRAARQARDALGLTQEQVAEKLGVSAEFYARLERGRAHPSLATFLGMMSVLGVSADMLLGVDAASRAAPAVVPLVMPEDPPAVRELACKLRQAPPGTLRLVSMLLKAFEEPRASGKRTGSTRSARPADND